MEEIKNEAKKECCGEKDCCEEKKCCLSACKHCPTAHKIFKVILAVIMVCALLRIGAEFGERRNDRFDGRGMMFSERGGFLSEGRQGGCPMMQQGDFKQGGCQALSQVGDAQGGCPMMERIQSQKTIPTTLSIPASTSTLR